jgi:hypothetical protein
MQMRNQQTPRNREDMNNGRVSRITYPTASFSLTTDMILHIHEQAEFHGVSKSQFIRSLILRDMEEIDEAAMPIATPTEEDDAA